MMKKIYEEGYNACCMEHGLECRVPEVKVVAAGKKERVKSAGGGKMKSKSKYVKAAFPLPFIKVNEEQCNGIKTAGGLYIQCPQKRPRSGEYCKTCAGQCERNESGKPDNGCAEDRLSADYRGPKGEVPKAYALIMKKLELTREQVMEEASKFGLEIGEEHFVMPEGKRGRPGKKSDASVESKKRGRPKKAVKEVVAEETEDLFASLVEEEVSDLSESDNESDKESVKSTKEEEKAAAAVAKEQKKAATAAAKEQEKAATAAAKEQEKAATAAAKEQEKAAKLAAKEQEKAATAAAKEQEKAAKVAAAAAKEQEKAAAAAAKDQKKALKEAAKEEGKKEEVKKPKKSKSASEIQVVEVVVKGTTFYRSKNGVIYDKDSNEVGVWNDEKNEIEFKECESEEEEEEYESESEEESDQEEA